jgi:hypothetical protein
MTSPGRIYLTVPWIERQRVRMLGGRWCYDEKRWYILDGTDPAPFVAAGLLVPTGRREPALTARGLPPTRALRVFRQDGQPYTLALEAVADWWASDHPRLSYVQMTGGAAILVQGTGAMIAAAFAEAACCPIAGALP